MSFPVDILTEILHFLPLSDAISLLRSCRQWFYNRSLWLVALEQACTLNPLPVPPGRKLYNLDIETLQKLAAKAQHVAQSLAQRYAREKYFKSFHLAPLDTVLGQITGTNILFVNRAEARYVECWDVVRNIGFGSIETFGECTMFPPFIKDEAYTLAIVGHDGASTSVIVISADYSHPENLKFTENFRRVVPAPIWRHTSITMCSESVGVLAYWSNGHVSLGTITADHEFSFSADIEDSSEPSLVQFHAPLYADGKHCFLWSEGGQLKPTKISSFPIPFNGSKILPHSISHEFLESRGQHFVYPAQSSMYGIRAVSHSTNWFEFYLDFWARKAESSNPVTCGIKFQNISIQPSFSKISVPPSGRSVLVVTPQAIFLPGVGDVNQMDYELVTVNKFGNDLMSSSWDDEEAWTWHSLSVPMEVLDPDDMNERDEDDLRVFWDDHLGVMRLVHRGTVFSIFYA